MLRITAVVVALLAVAAGAFFTGHNSVSPVKAAEVTPLRDKGFGPSDIAASVDFYNATQLEDSVLTMYNNTPPVTHRAQSATCVNVGRRSTCLLRTRTVNVVATITLSPDGQNYIAVAQP